MCEEFKVEGVKSAIKCFNSLEKELLNPKQPLEKSGIYMKEEALMNFPAEGTVFEEKWPALSPITLKIKEKKGFGGQPMMVRTGRLRDSFISHIEAIANGRGVASVSNSTPYAILHQQGVGRLPRRVLLKLAERQRSGITDIFFNWVVQKVRTSFSN